MSANKVCDKVLVVPDALAEESRLEIDTHTPKGWRVGTLSEWLDPYSKVTGCNFVRAYKGSRQRDTAVAAVAWDWGRTLALMTQYWAISRRDPDSVTCFPYGWGKSLPKGAYGKVSPHNPPLRAKARPVGWKVSFDNPKLGAPEEPYAYGEWVDDPDSLGKKTPWRGNFIDLWSVCYFLNGAESRPYDWHRQHFGLDPSPLPLAVSVDRDGAAEVIAAVMGLKDLAIEADAKAAKCLGGLDLTRASSPAYLSERLLEMAGAKPLLTELSDTELEHWMQNLRGGWLSAHPEYLGRCVKAWYLDLCSAYGRSAHLLRGWDVLSAEHLDREDVTEEFTELCKRATIDPSIICDPQVWGRFGLTLCAVRPAGQPFFVELGETNSTEGRPELLPFDTGGLTVHYPWPDVLAAAVKGGSVPEITSAIKLVPNGQALTRTRLSVFPGLELDLESDPIPTLYRHRKQFPVLKLIINTLVWGNPSRFDLFRRAGTTQERPGPCCFPPLATTVTAGTRLLLVLLDRLVTEAGGTVVYRDTDSSYVVGLEEAAIKRIIAMFGPLSADPDWPVWKDALTEIEVLGNKRYVTYQAAQRDGIVTISDWKESSLGGTYVNPPGIPGLTSDWLGWRWTKAWHLLRIVNGAAYHEPDAYFPALRRFQVTPAALRPKSRLRKALVALGAKPGSYYLQASYRFVKGAAIALDKGDDHANWRSLIWVDRHTAEPILPAIEGDDFCDPNAIRVKTLKHIEQEWVRPKAPEALDSVDLERLRVVGKTSAVYSASKRGLANPTDELVVYSDLRTCKLPECNELVHIPADYCNRTHQNRGTKREQRAKQRLSA